MLDTFSEVETTALLEELSKELRARLRKDLLFFLSEFSQGYPWLLKKLCAHVKAQREKGVPQSDMANSLLNVEELFEEDLSVLSPEEEDALRRIAKAAPISVADLGDEFSPQVVQSLVNARLIVRIANKYDIYWDIFRDYLNGGRVPAQENYIPWVQSRTVLKATKLLSEAGGALSRHELRRQADLSENSFHNVARDMRLLGLAKVDVDKVVLQVNLPQDADVRALEEPLRTHLRDRLKRNRLVSRLIGEVESQGALSMAKVSMLLAEWCPYISASDATWRLYARIFAGWLDFADLAIYDSQNRNLEQYTAGKEVRKHDLLLPKRRGGSRIPCVQYGPAERVAIRIVEAAEGNRAVDWTGIRKRTMEKALITLEDLEFINRKSRSIEITPRGSEFVGFPERRAALFAESALKIHAFAAFIDVLNGDQDVKRSSSQLAEELQDTLGVHWRESTAKTNVKIMLDWARHTRLAPANLAQTARHRSASRRSRALQMEMALEAP